MILPRDEVLGVGGHLTDAVLLQLGLHLPHLHTQVSLYVIHVHLHCKNVTIRAERLLQRVDLLCSTVSTI